MSIGDDISNLLRKIGPDAGIYQDLSQYNAARGGGQRRGLLGRAQSAPPQPPAAEASAPAAPSIPHPPPRPRGFLRHPPTIRILFPWNLPRLVRSFSRHWREK